MENLIDIELANLNLGEVISRKIKSSVLTSRDVITKICSHELSTNLYTKEQNLEMVSMLDIITNLTLPDGRALKILKTKGCCIFSDENAELLFKRNLSLLEECSHVIYKAKIGIE